MSSDPPEPAGAPAPEAATAEAPQRGLERAGPPIRLAIDAEGVGGVARDPLVAALAEGPALRAELRLAYFDTPARDLARAGLALGVRAEGSRWLQVVEALHPADGVAELDTAGLARGEPDVDAIEGAALRVRVAEAIGRGALQRLFEVELVRFRRTLAEDGDALRLDVEAGEVRTPNGNVPVREVVLASLGGDPGAPHRLALELAQRISLRPVAASPAARGYERLRGRGPATHRARPPAVAPDARVDDLLAAVLADGLRQLVANEPAASLGADPEGVHQLRVAVRRLRSALAFFGAVLPAEDRDALRAELRWLGAALGPARDLDVFTSELLAGIARARPDDAALARLLARAEAHRADAAVRVREALASPRWTALVLRLGAWIARRAWRAQPLDERSAALFRPARAWSAEILARRHRKVRKLGRQAEQLDAEARHALRIRLKKLRYAAEFSAPLHRGRRAERYARRLARLQDALGHLNDVATAERLLAELGARPGSDAGAEAWQTAGFVAGWLSHSAHVELAELPERWKRFERACRFWQSGREAELR